MMLRSRSRDSYHAIRVVLLCLLVAVLLGLILLYRPNPFARTRGAFVAARAPVPSDAFSPFEGDSSLTLEALRERAMAAYRLRPDARWLRAVGEVRRLAGGPDSTVSARFDAGHWVVSCGTQEVGSLSELPDFPELLDVLTDWARTHAWARKWSNTGGPRRLDLQYALDRLDAKAALAEADKAWGKGARDATLFRYTTRAYTLWALETPDQVRLSEGIEARALATLAYARALGAEEPAREACLLADVLGYSADARTRALTLAASDPVRMYVTWNDAKLREAAAASPTFEAPFLQLLRVARRADYETWLALLPGFEQAGVPPEAVMATGLGMPRFDAHVPAAEAVLLAVAEGTAPAKRAGPSLRALLSGPTLAVRLADFERTLASQPIRPGVLLAPDLVRAQRRSLVYSALDRIGHHYMESLSSVEMARWFALDGPGARPGPARDFQRWYAHLASAMAGRADLAALRGDIDSVASGPDQALRTLETVRTLIPLGDPSLRGAVQAVVRRLDTRPRHRIALGDLAAGDLGAATLAERCYASAAGAEGAANLHQLARLARFRGDTDSLGALMARPDPDPWQRRSVLSVAVGADELPDSVIQRAFEREIASTAPAWPVADEYADWLESRKRYPEARIILERWLSQARADSGSGFEEIFARTQIARLHQLEGHPDVALRTLGDVSRTQQFGAMQRTALVLQDLGRGDQALAVAWEAHRRYPHLLVSRVVLLELLWRQGHYAQAASILTSDPMPVSGQDWMETIAPRFVACFRGRDREGIKAAEALMKAGFRDQATIGTLGHKLSAEGLDGLAFEIQSRIQATGIQQVESAARGYGFLKKAKGEQAALSWLKRRLPAGLRDPLGMFAHQEGLNELLWSLPPRGLEGTNGDYYWLMRAAACMESGPSHPHYAETALHLTSTQGSYYLDIARYLMGLREEAQILPLARSMKRRAEVYYFVGLKAQHEGRLRDAADWYLLSVETGAINNAEPRWAYFQLRRWIAKDRSLDVIARARPPA